VHVVDVNPLMQQYATSPELRVRPELQASVGSAPSGVTLPLQLYPVPCGQDTALSWPHVLVPTVEQQYPTRPELRAWPELQTTGLVSSGVTVPLQLYPVPWVQVTALSWLHVLVPTVEQQYPTRPEPRGVPELQTSAGSSGVAVPSQL
jgi:hypothetical protein